MLTAIAHEEAIDEVLGARFRTNARPGTESERQLQEIQNELSGGEIQPILAHLNRWPVGEVPDGPNASGTAIY